MAGFDTNRWLAKITGQKPPARADDAANAQGRAPRRGNLIVKETGQLVTHEMQNAQQGGSKQLTRAAMVYALGAGALFVMALFNFMSGNIFNGIVVTLPAACLVVLAYKYLQ